MLFRNKVDERSLTPLAGVGPAGASEADTLRRSLRPLSGPSRALLIDALRNGSLAGAEALMRHRLPHLKIETHPFAGVDWRVFLEISPRRIVLHAEREAPAELAHHKYNRIVDIAPLLNYLATQTIGSGSIGVDVSDDGRIDDVSFSGPAGAPLIPDSHFLGSGAYERERYDFRSPLAWRDRRPVVLWRGSTTGVRSAGWRSLDRTRLCEFSRESRSPLELDVGFTEVVQADSPDEENAIRDAGLMRDRVAATTYGDYRYHIDIDGNVNAWSGLYTKLLSGALVFKVASTAGHTQWYYPRLEPWKHFIPVDAGLSDFDERLQWAATHDEEAAMIAQEGRRFAQSLELESEAGFAVDVMGDHLVRAPRGRR